MNLDGIDLGGVAVAAFAHTITRALVTAAVGSGRTLSASLRWRWGCR